MVCTFPSPQRVLLKVTSFGNLFSWGQNHQGQLGDGTMMPRDTPGLLGEVLGASGQHDFGWHHVAMVGIGMDWGDYAYANSWPYFGLEGAG